MRVQSIISRLSLVKRYHYKWAIYIALSWTAIDAFYWGKYKNIGTRKIEETFHSTEPDAILLRSILVFCCSLIICYQLIFKIRTLFRDSPRLIYIGLKTVLFFLSTYLLNFILHFAFAFLIEHRTLTQSVTFFYSHVYSTLLLLEHTIGWTILFLLSHLFIEINEKYSPGIFLQIWSGKYIQPRVEKRIVMFIDMQGSTSIAEKLGSKKHFMLIRDFIYFLSLALLEFDGRIYQYVGDEIVVSWQHREKNIRKAVAALVYSKRLFQKNKSYFMKRYGLVPEFKVGLHCGEVTVGEIGIIKKDLVISGDTMNTTARIRDACNEFDRPYMVSGDFINNSNVNYKVESIGNVELEGKSKNVELFALLI